jgi:glycosyltransferase involved in cell wall biosynthesis
MKQYIPYLHGGNIPKIIENKHSEFIKYLKGSKNIVVQTDYLNSVMLQNGIMNSIRIPNFIDLENYHFKNRNCVDEVSILWVRAYQKIYNPKLMVDLCILLLEQGFKPKICMIGPEKDNSKSEVLNLIQEKNLEKYFNIKSRLSRSEWVNYSSGYNFFINTSNVDNTPVSVIEAMALGMIVISTNVGGLPKLIEDSVNGFLVDPNDANQILNLINTIISRKELNVSLNARKKAKTFDWTEVKEDWKRCFYLKN